MSSVEHSWWLCGFLEKWSGSWSSFSTCISEKNRIVICDHFTQKLKWLMMIDNNLWEIDNNWQQLMTIYDDWFLTLINQLLLTVINCNLSKKMQKILLQKNKLKSLKVAKWRKDEWRMMNEWRMNENDERWRLCDERWRI